MMTNSWLNEDITKLNIAEAVSDMAPGSCILVTGATGLIGSMLCRTLCMVSERDELDLKICALARNTEKAAKVLADVIEDNNITIANDLSSIDFKVDYIIHTACPTKSDFFVNNPVETIQTIVGGTQDILEFAKEQNVKSVVYLSSMEVYGLITEEKKLAPEDIGYVNNLSLRSSYPEGKRLAELLCVSFFNEYNVPVKVVRLAQTFGPGIPKEDNRVFAQFIKAAVSGEDIVMHTRGRSKRMYIDTIDAVSAILTVLCKGENGAVYNAGNEDNYCSIKEMADMVIKEFGTGENKVVIDQKLDNGQYPPENILLLDVDELRKLGWKPTYNLKDMYQRMLDVEI